MVQRSAFRYKPEVEDIVVGRVIEVDIFVLVFWVFEIGLRD